MTHNSAVRAVVELVPEIEKSGAEKALVAYAEKEDLPPAQLEKLAQVFNTLRQVSHIDNADNADRGDTIPLVDVPVLVTGYATGIGAEKSATPRIAAPSHLAKHVDLMQQLKAELSPEVPMEKAAAAEPEKGGYDFSKEDAAAAILDLSLDTREEMGKLAADIMQSVPTDFEGKLDIATCEQDALQSRARTSVRDAGDWVEKYATPHRLEVSRLDYAEELEKSAMGHMSAAGDLLVELVDKIHLYESLKKMAMVAGGRTYSKGEVFDDPLWQEEDPLSDPNDDEGGDGGDGGGGDGSSPPPPSSGKETPVKRKDEWVKGEVKPAEKTKEDKTNQETPKEPGNRLAVVTAPYRGTLKGVDAVSEKFKTALGDITGRERQNKDQKKTDISVADIKRSLRIRRMIGTDPVLREADQAEVLEIYNSIAEQNPDIASNMAALKLVLREAVSYEGLTLDSTKQLADIRDKGGKSELQDADNSRRRYSVGNFS